MKIGFAVPAASTLAKAPGTIVAAVFDGKVLGPAAKELDGLTGGAVARALFLNGPPQLQRKIRNVGVFVVREEGAHEGQGGGRGQTLGGGGELAARLDVGFARGERDQAADRFGARRAGVTDEAGAPQAHKRVGVSEGFAGEGLVKAAAEVERPQRLERELTRAGAHRVAQGRWCRKAASSTCSVASAA